jgi:hypothetical protein
MRIKKELQAVCGGFGVKAGGYQSTWEDIQALAVAHSVGAVVRDFTAYLEEFQGDDFPNGAVSKYAQIASDRLSRDTAPLQQAIRDPEVVSLVRELSSLSDGQIAFLDKHRGRLAEVLREFGSEDIIAAFRSWLIDQDLSDPKTLKWGAGDFVQKVDQIAYTARKKKSEAETTQAARDAAVRRLQNEAETQRLLREAQLDKEENCFDPLSD